MKKILVVALMILSVLFCSCREDITETQLRWGNEAVLCREGEEFVLYDGEHSGGLILYNFEDKRIDITLYTDDGAVEIGADGGQIISAGPVGGRLTALRYVFGGEDEAYALTADGLSALLESDAPRITLLRDVSVEGDLIISRGVCISAENHSLTASGSIIYKTEKAEKLELTGNVTAKGFDASAPLAEALIPEALVPEFAHTTLKIHILNGEVFHKEFHTASSKEELRAIARSSIHDDVVIRGFEITEDITLEGFAKIVLDGCDPAGRLTLKGENVTVTGDFEAEDIKVEASSLTVDEPIEIEKAARLYSVETYCGYSVHGYGVGGEGTAEIKNAILKADGKMMTADLTWEADGYILRGKYTGVCAPEALRDCFVEFECEGTVLPDDISRGESGGLNLLSPFGCYVTVTDEGGKTLRYKIETEFSAALPVVVITTDGTEISRDEYKNATVSLECDFADGFESLEDQLVQIKGRGNSTWKWSDKKPYKIKYQNEVSLLGLCGGKDWVLLANYNDKTLIRNYIALEMAKFMDNMDCYATQYPVDVFVDGKYAGVYTLGEEIEAGDGRVEIKSDATSMDTGYLLELGGSDEGDAANVFSTYLMQSVEILEPDENTVSDKYVTYISNYVSAADDAVRSGEGYEDYIDVDSLIDWLIVTELSFNSDGAMRRSVFLKKDAGGKLEMASMWDFDIAFGNSNTDFINYHAWACLATDYGYVRDNWICYLMRDEEFVSRLRDRWNLVKEPLYKLTCEKLEYAYGITKTSAEANFEVWDILGYPVAIQPYYIGWYNTYDEQVDFLRDFINHRFSFIEAELNGGA